MKRFVQITTGIGLAGLIGATVMLGLTAVGQRHQLRALRAQLAATTKVEDAGSSSLSDLDQRLGTLEQSLGDVASSSDSNSVSAASLAQRVTALELEVNGISGPTVVGQDIQSQLQQLQQQIGDLQYTVDCLVRVTSGSVVARC